MCCCLDYGYKKQGFNRKELLYYSPLQPYLAWWGMSWAALFVVVSGIRTWFKWDASAFLTFCEFSSLCTRPSYEICLVCPQTSTFPSSLFCTSATRSSRRPRSASGMRWTSSLVSQHLRRRKFQKSHPGTFGKRSLPFFSK